MYGPGQSEHTHTHVAVGGKESQSPPHLEDVLEADNVRVRDLPEHLRLLHQLPRGQPRRQPELARLDHLCVFHVGVVG